MDWKRDWDRIEDLFHSALEFEVSRRADYLREKCGDDHTLFAEVLELIAADQRESDFLADSAVGLGFAAIENTGRQPSVVGRMIGNYLVEVKLGEGGMGEVYLARDKTLERNVALKFLLTPNFDDPLLRQRLFREAQVAASLDHPNICRIYGLEKAEGLDFIVMQHVEGRTLSALIEDGVRLTTSEICEVARQIVAGVAATHACGLIHRDIKPSNIIRTPDGQIVILDFGLAKRVQVTGETGPSTDVSSGLVFGTVCYMSPEQLRNEKLDLQSDIFSLGVLLFQLCTLRNPFSRESPAESISAVLNDVPDLSLLDHSHIPPGLKRIISRCLKKEKANRYGSAIELLADIDGIQRNTGRFSRRWSGPRMSGLLITATVITTLAVGLSSYWLGLTNSTHRLLILPLKNMTGDPTLDYLGQGISDGISGRLGRSSPLQDFKILRYDSLGNSSLGNADDLEAVAKKAGADIVISGELKLDDEERVLVSIEAHDVSKDGTLWATSCSGERGDPLGLEEAAFSRIATALRITAPFPIRGKNDQVDPEAYKNYLLGQYSWRKRDPENLRKAIDAFQRSIDQDPTYAPAHAGLARSYAIQSLVPYGRLPPGEGMMKARAAARQAIQLDEQNGDAHTSLGIVLSTYDHDWSGAEKQFLRAIAINPDDAVAHYWYAGMLADTGRMEEALPQALAARELDPFSPLSAVNVARVYYYERQFDRALEVLRREQQDGSDDAKIRYMIGLVLIQEKRYGEAQPIFEQIYSENKLFGAAALGFVLARSGNQKRARALIDELGHQGGTLPAQEIAIVFAGLNDRPNAIKYLRMAVESHHPATVSLRVEPLYDAIRSGKGFSDLLRLANLPDYAISGVPPR